ncbi:MAG: SET domain-containing protein-lysine N-methyltransferase [Spirochaetes bacterium]|jgi:tyrocidine synthetase-3|nr:SET domain-containing protein-lysine N-methyltransferase [Spirochaetota bacterium]
MVEEVVPDRFYPEFYPRFPYEPTKERFDIIKTDDVGEGIISLAVFRPGETVFRFAGILMDEMTLFTLQLQPGHHLHDPFFMGKVLHSCEPNMACDMASQTFTAVREIKPGDFLTMDYETTEDQLFRSFECHCGSPNCRKFIMGRKSRIQHVHDGFDVHYAVAET